MGPLDALWHLGNLFAPALLLGALSAGFSKLVWRRELAGMGWQRLAGPACAVAVVATVSGLLAFGHDGRMATYGAMVAGCALTLWWQGFGPGRR